jgi:AcrR family transcriptional regulator
MPAATIMVSMSVQAENTRRRRRHSTGEATRELLMVTAERLFAMNGLEGVTLREIQAEAGQSNSSVITYHFGSQAGLVRALLEFRYRTINARRAELLRDARDQGVSGDPRAAVWLIVRPLIESIEAGEMFVPFLARVSANPRAFAEYLPRGTDESTVDVLREMVPGLLSEMPDRARLGREVQLYNSVLNLLAELARGHHRISEAQLSNYVDGWVGMLTAPLSASTAELMRQEETARQDRS